MFYTTQDSNRNLSAHVIEVDSKPTEDDEHFVLPIHIDTIADYGSIILSILVAISIKGLKDSKDKIERALHGINLIKSDQDKRILPSDYIKRLDQIMAQIAIVGSYDRVVLGIFHNGVIGAKHSRFDKIAIISAYAVSGVEQLPEQGKDINVEDISLYLDLLKKDEVGYTKINSTDLNVYDNSCYLYLKRRNIHQIENFLLARDNTDLGIISFHYCSNDIPDISESNLNIIKDLVREVESIIDIYAKTNRTFI